MLADRRLYDVPVLSTDVLGASGASGPCSAPDIVATGPEAGSASVGGAPSVDGAMLMGTASAAGGGAEAEESSILLAAEDVEDLVKCGTERRAQAVGRRRGVSEHEDTNLSD